MQRQTADPLPFAARHWQSNVAQDCDADCNYNQTFEVGEEHNTSATPEKKHMKSDEVDSPGPYDKYDVKARGQDTCPIEEPLQSVRNLVLEGRYNSTDQQRISYSKYHEKEIGSVRPVKKGKGCSCEKGCGKNCGCKKTGMRCHSGRFCNGNCCAQGE